MVSGSSRLKEDSEDLKLRLDRVDADLNIELDAVRRLEEQGLQVGWVMAATTVTHESQESEGHVPLGFCRSCWRPPPSPAEQSRCGPDVA